MDAAPWSAKIAAYQAKVSLWVAQAEADRARIIMSAAPMRASPAKCPCCGSREFKAHNDVRICSYCRSAA